MSISVSDKPKCAYLKCEHETSLMHQEYHEEGMCWKITQEEFKDYPTNAKYCPCSRSPELIRRYAKVGYMERGQFDQMITRPCARCGDDCLFTIHDKLCLSCKEMVSLEDPLPK